MSAFIVADKTMGDIYSGLRMYGNDAVLRYDIKKFLGGRQIEEVVDILFRLNIRAVNQRYGDERAENMTRAELKVMCKVDLNVSVYQFLKSLECLHYQMAEGDVPNTKEYQMLGTLINDICVAMVHKSADYEKAEWGR